MFYSHVGSSPLQSVWEFRILTKVTSARHCCMAPFLRRGPSALWHFLNHSAAPLNQCHHVGISLYSIFVPKSVCAELLFDFDVSSSSGYVSSSRFINYSQDDEDLPKSEWEVCSRHWKSTQEVAGLDCWYVHLHLLQSVGFLTMISRFIFFYSVQQLWRVKEICIHDHKTRSSFRLLLSPDGCPQLIPTLY